MRRRPPSSTRTDTLFPDTTRCRSQDVDRRLGELLRPRGRVRRLEGDVLAVRLALGAEPLGVLEGRDEPGRSEEHTSELQSLMRISYAVFCLTNKKPSLQNAYTQVTPTHKIARLCSDQTLHKK